MTPRAGPSARRAGGRGYRHACRSSRGFSCRCGRREDARRRRRWPRTKMRPPLDSEARALLDTLAEQTAAALDRASLAREMVQRAERRPRPSACATRCWPRSRTISARRSPRSSARRQPDRLRRQARRGRDARTCWARSRHEAEGLDEMVRNLLAMTRIDAGALELRRDWIDLREIVERVVQRRAPTRREADDRCRSARRSAAGARRRHARRAGARQCRRQRRRAHAARRRMS